MNRLERIHKIDEMITRQGTVAIDEFLSTLDISLATFKRDLDYLRATLHAPVVWDRSRGGYSYGKRKGRAAVTPMPTLWSGARDTHALLAAHGLLAAVKSGPLKEEVQGLCARLLTLLAAQGDAPAQIERRFDVRVPAVADDHPAFAALASALLKRRRVRLQVASARKRNTPDVRLLSPVCLQHDGTQWMLHAFDHAGNKACVIALSDCSDPQILNEKAKDGSLKTAK